jgi:hypothetical protein
LSLPSIVHAAMITVIGQTKGPPDPAPRGDPTGRSRRPAGYFWFRLKLMVTVSTNPVGSPFRRSGW